MSDSSSDGRPQQVLKWFAVLLVLFAAVMVVVGEFLVAGVTFLGLTLVLYLRETM